MSNPLVDLQKIVGSKDQKSFTAKVISISGSKVKVRLNTGNTMFVWGSASLNSTVMIKGKQIIATVGKESTNVVYVP